MSENKKLKILFVSAEVTPYAKTGGLADVAGSLPLALIGKGHDVRIVMPRYKKVVGTLAYETDFPVVMDWRKETCVVRKDAIKFTEKNSNIEVPIYFIDSYQYFEREHMYCYFDEAERFAFFAKAVIDMLPKIDFKPDVIHCNDWQSGPICMLLKEEYKDNIFFKDIATLFTIHNLQYQGNYSIDAIKYFGLNSNFTLENLEFYGALSFMKAGLNYADIINTVSETYAKEIRTAEYGEKFEGLLTERSEDLYGIINGISYEENNPATDSSIYKNYDVSSIKNKAQNKHKLQKEMGLPKSDVPLVGLISRLVNQKGLDLIGECIHQIMKTDLQLVILGLGDEYYENLFKNLRQKYPDKVGVFIGFNAELAQKIYAGSDMFLMPSKFEPCGLGQLISLRYGTIPIVRETGGLADTIRDYNPLTKEGNGFTFKEYSSNELLKTINRSVDLYKSDKKIWLKLIEDAMNEDFSWNRSAEKYIELYKDAVKKKKN